MLIERLIDFYIEMAKKHPGNPFRLSNSGRCARALAYQRFPSTFKSEPMPARAFGTKGKCRENNLPRSPYWLYK
jgi:hypothetical protein